MKSIQPVPKDPIKFDNRKIIAQNKKRKEMANQLTYEEERPGVYKVYSEGKYLGYVGLDALGTRWQPWDDKGRALSGWMPTRAEAAEIFLL